MLTQLDPQLVIDLVIQSLNERGVFPKTDTEESLRARLMAKATAQQEQQAANNAAKLLAVNPLTAEGTTVPKLGVPAITPDGPQAPQPANQPTRVPAGTTSPRMPNGTKPTGAKAS